VGPRRQMQGNNARHVTVLSLFLGLLSLCCSKDELFVFRFFVFRFFVFLFHLNTSSSLSSQEPLAAAYKEISHVEAAPAPALHGHGGSSGGDREFLWLSLYLSLSLSVSVSVSLSLSLSLIESPLF
jgi:hypothetical protein